MIRHLLTAGALAALCACQPAAQKAAPAEATPAATTPGAPAVTSTTEVPAAYDWSFNTHGGSADLDFGDGDQAEGASLFHLSCLPNSAKVEMSWGYPHTATLASGGHSATFDADASAPAGHPVFAALRATRTLTMNEEGAVTVMTAKAAGGAALDGFFNYCTTPLPPQG